MLTLEKGIIMSHIVVLCVYLPRAGCPVNVQPARVPPRPLILYSSQVCSVVERGGHIRTVPPPPQERCAGVVRSCYSAVNTRENNTFLYTLCRAYHRHRRRRIYPIRRRAFVYPRRAIMVIDGSSACAVAPSFRVRPTGCDFIATATP